MGAYIYKMNGWKWGIGTDALPIKTISNAKFAIHSQEDQEHYWAGQSSAWNDEEVIRVNIQNVAKSGKPMGEFVEPLEWKDRQLVKYSRGNFVAYSGWFYGNLGHFSKFRES